MVPVHTNNRPGGMFRAIEERLKPNVARRACRFGNDPVHGGAASPDEWAAIEKKRKEQLKKLNEEQQTTPPMLPMLSAAERQSGLGSI